MFCPFAFRRSPVAPASNQSALLKSNVPKLAANKRLTYDFFRNVLRAGAASIKREIHEDRLHAAQPNADTGIKGFKEFLSTLGWPNDSGHAAWPGGHRG
jgi:hypothetical protein